MEVVREICSLGGGRRLVLPPPWAWWTSAPRPAPLPRCGGTRCAGCNVCQRMKQWWGQQVRTESAPMEGVKGAAALDCTAGGAAVIRVQRSIFITAAVAVAVVESGTVGSGGGIVTMFPGQCVPLLRALKRYSRLHGSRKKNGSALQYRETVESLTRDERRRC